MINPTILTFDYSEFIALFPAYANAIMYPELILQQYWNSAINYISDIGNVGTIQGDQRQYAINLMTAHLTYISGLIANGQTPYVANSVTIDKVNVGLTPPPMSNEWQWWLNASPYGQQLLALLQANSAGGFYIGGSPVRSAFETQWYYGDL